MVRLYQLSLRLDTLIAKKGVAPKRSSPRPHAWEDMLYWREDMRFWEQEPGGMTTRER